MPYHRVQGLVLLLQLVYDALESLELSVQLPDALFVLLQVALGSFVLLDHQSIVVLKCYELAFSRLDLLLRLLVDAVQLGQQLGVFLSLGLEEGAQSFQLLSHECDFGLALILPSD
jgi:hypothetical protein